MTYFPFSAALFLFWIVLANFSKFRLCSASNSALRLKKSCNSAITAVWISVRSPKLRNCSVNWLRISENQGSLYGIEFFLCCVCEFSEFGMKCEDFNGEKKDFRTSNLKDWRCIIRWLEQISDEYKACRLRMRHFLKRYNSLGNNWVYWQHKCRL